MIKKLQNFAWKNYRLDSFKIPTGNFPPGILVMAIPDNSREFLCGFDHDLT